MTTHNGMVTVRWSVGAFGALVMGLAAAGCSSLLDVPYPGRIPVEQLDNPNLAAVLALGVVGDLECAYNNYFSAAAAHSDEFEASNDNGLLANAGERNTTADNDDYATGPCEANVSDFGLQVPMHTARYQAEDVYNRLNSWTDAQMPAGVNRTALMAKVRAYGAYAYTFFGETYCEFYKDGVKQGGSPGSGTTRDPASLAVASNTAVQQFTEAISLATQSGGDPDIINLANVGLARANMDLKNWPEAAAAAAKVPPGWELYATRGIENDRRWNKLYYFFNSLGAFVISNSYRDLNDPRVPIQDLHRGAFNPDIDLWVTTKYTSLADPIRLASYREARLILAEALASQGDAAGAMDILNTRRGEVGLAPLPATTDPAVAVNNVIEERRRELAFEGGHRLNDLLRKDIPWKVSGTTNPFTGRPYGATTCWPTPTKEINGAKP